MIRALLVVCTGLASLMPMQLQAQAEAQAYYPTQPGDTWTYQSSIRGRFTNQVEDLVVVDGTGLVRIRSTDASGGEQWLAGRLDGSRLYLGPAQGPQTLLADFALEPGASATLQQGERQITTAVRARHASRDVFGLTFEDVVEVHLTTASGGGTTYFFARDVGLVGLRSDDSGMHVRLVSAIVGGRAFGTALPSTP